MEIDKSKISLLKTVGSGRFGFVRRGIYRKSNSEKIVVAVKEIHINPNDQNNPVNKKDVFHEVNLIQKAKHPNIVGCYGVYFEEEEEEDTDDDEEIFLLPQNEITKAGIVLEYCEGDLQKYLQKMEKKLSFEMKIAMLIQLASAIEYLHSIGIVHRDLKPQNVLVKKEKDGYILKICDFGSSKTLSSISNTFTGTVLYFPPETVSPYNFDLQKEDKKKIDVYSFGVIAFQVLSEEVPYLDLIEKVGGELALINLIHKKKLRPALDKIEHFPKKVVNLIEKCWSEDPKDRPTFFEILQILREYNNKKIEDERKKIELISQGNIYFNKEKNIFKTIKINSNKKVLTIFEKEERDFSNLSYFQIKESSVLFDKNVLYFEIKIESLDTHSRHINVLPFLQIGLKSTHYDFQMDQSLLWKSNDGCVYNCRSCVKYLSKFGVNDVIGCGWHFLSNKVFFTLNGRIFSERITKSRDHFKGKLFPTVSFKGKGISIQIMDKLLFLPNNTNLAIKKDKKKEKKGFFFAKSNLLKDFFK